MKIMIGLISLSVIAPIVLTFTGLHINTGSGSQVGYVSAVEKTGLIWKTGRAYIKPTLESTQEDIYCVVDEKVLVELETASVNKSKIKVNHFSWLTNGITNCELEPAVIKSFEIINPSSLN